MTGPWEKYQRAPQDESGPWSRYAGEPSNITSTGVPGNESSWTDNIRDPIAGALKIGPTAIKGVADLARLMTGDRLGVDTSGAMQRGMQSIDEVIGSERLRSQKGNIDQALQNPDIGLTQLPGIVADNPRAALDATVSTIGSMFLPVGAAAGATKLLPGMAKLFPSLAGVTPGAVATGASIGTGAAQNAAETFADTAGQDMADRYTGAGISGAASLILGKLLGGGAEGVVARRLAGETGARGALAMGKSAAMTGGKEFLQETGEESSNYVGKQVAKNKAIDPNTMGKQGLYGGMIGFGMGGASDLATNIGNVGKGSAESQIAAAINQAAQEFSDRAPPQTIQQTVARIFDRMPERQAPEPQPAPPQPAPDVASRILQAIEQTQNVVSIHAPEGANLEEVTPRPDEFYPPAVEAPAPAPVDATPIAGVPAEPAGPSVEAAGLTFDDLVPNNTPAASDTSAPSGVTPPVTQPAQPVMGQGAGATQPTQAAPQNTPSLNTSQQPVQKTPGIEQVAPTPKKPAGARNLRAAAYDKNPMMTFLATHGLFHDKTKSNSQKSEFSPDKGIMVMGYGPVFKRTGKQPSDLVVNAIEDGYLPQNGTADQLHNLIRRAMAGEKISPMYAEGAAEKIAQERIDAQPQYADFLDAAQQDPMDSDPFGPLDLELLGEVGFNEAQPETQAEFRAIVAHAESMGIDADMILMDVTDQVGSQATQQEYHEAAITAVQAAIKGSHGNGSQVSGAQSAEAGPAAPAAGQPDQADGLSSYTPEEVTQRLDRLEQAETERKAADAKAEQDATKARERKEVQRRSEAAADTFELGQSAEDNLSGQANIFDAQEEGATYNAEAPRRKYTDDKQLQLFLDSEPDPSQTGPAADRARREAVAAVDDLRSTQTLLAQALSGDYAARQRASLVGQKVASAEDLAVLAQVYRDPRFETFRVVFVNDSGAVVSQVGLTSRLPSSTAAIMGSDIDAYLKDLSATARSRGASGYYLLHNHPSGIPTPSRADMALTRQFAQKMPMLAFKSHVVIDTNEYSAIDRDGFHEQLKKDFGQSAPYLAAEWARVKITGPDDVMAMAKRLQVDEDAVTLIHTDAQFNVKAISTLPTDATIGEPNAVKRQIVKASLKVQGSQVFAVSHNSAALLRVGSFVRDGIHVRRDGSVKSMAANGGIPGGEPFPRDRRTRLSPDTSPEFGYLRAQAQATAGQYAAEPEQEQVDTPAFRKWYGNWQNAADEKATTIESAAGLAGQPAGGASLDARRSGPLDPQGRPARLYHGTADDITAFEVGHKNSKDHGWLGQGVYLTDSADLADSYANLKAGDVGPNVMPVYAAIKNPFEATLADKKRIKNGGQVAAERFTKKLKAEGFDGVVLTYPDGIREFVAFESTQVKSAIGNNGDFDGTNASIVREDGQRYKAEGLQSAANTWTVPEPGTFDNAVRAIQNNKIDLKRVRDAITERYGNVKTSADAYLNEELYHGKVAARVEALHKESVEPILAKIAVAGKNVGVTVDDVNQYLHARHAPERNAAMKAINPDMDNNDALSGMSDQEAAKVLRDFTAAGKDKALAMIAKDVDQLLNDTRTGLVADGLEDAGVVQAWESAYQHYVPLQRDIGSSGTPKGMGFSVRGPESKRAVGSNMEVVNILANIVTQAETAAIRAEKAVVGRSLLAMARQYPNPEFWKVDVVPTKPRVDKETGLVQRNAVDPLYQTADNVVMVKDYGQEHFIVFNEKNERAMAAAKAMKNLDVAPMNKIFDVVSKGTRFLASLLTQRNPLFWLTNFSRDIQGAMLNLEGTDAEGLQRKVMGNLPNAFKGMHALVRGEGKGQWARYANEMKEAGGITGYMQAFENSDARMKDLKKEVAKMQQGKADPRRLARITLEFVDDYNDIIENAVRLSVFQAARDNGVSTIKAASIAKNITVNFNRKGNLTPPINALYMFFNASLQGTARMAQAILTSKTAAAAVGGIAIMGFVLDALNRAMSDDDEETGRNRYDLIPEFDKSKNWIIMNPMRPGERVKIPLPLGPHVFHNAGRLISDAAFRDDPRNAAEYGWSMAGVFIDAFSPMGAAPSLTQLVFPSVLDPLAQVTENKSSTGAPLYKSADRFGKTDPKPAYTRYFESTPDVWKGASRLLNDMTGGDKDKPGAINIEPDILKHVFYTMTGGPGRTLDQAIDATQAGARGKDVTVNRIPFASRFYGANDDQQRERAYYEDSKRVSDAKTAFDYYFKLGRQADANKITAELGDGDAAKGRRLMMEFSRAGKSVRKINGEIRKRMESEADDEAKATQLRDLKKRRVRVMSDAVNDDDE